MKTKAKTIAQHTDLLRLSCIIALASALSISSTDADAKKTVDHRHGIWKSAVPPNGMKGEFDNHDPVGLATGARIKVDCSLNWPNPDTGKIYCFNSATSLVYFLDWPQRNIEKARKAWALIKDGKDKK